VVEQNIAGIYNLNYDFNYKKTVVFGITNLSLLMAKIKGDDKIAKTDDRWN
jgi:hypothetical protein